MPGTRQRHREVPRLTWLLTMFGVSQVPAASPGRMGLGRGTSSGSRQAQGNSALSFVSLESLPSSKRLSDREKGWLLGD